MTQVLGQVTMILVFVLAIILAVKFSKRINSEEKSYGEDKTLIKTDLQNTKQNTVISDYFCPAYISIRKKNGKPKKYLIEEGIRVGKNKDNDVVLNNQYVSDCAFAVGFDDVGYFLTVIGQKGLMTCERSFVRPNSSISLENNDKFYFAEYEVTFSTGACDIEGFNSDDEEDELAFDKVVRMN